MYPSFVANTWKDDLVDMPLISKFDKAFRFVLFDIDISSKYVSFIPLKNKKGITLLMLFIKS